MSLAPLSKAFITFSFVQNMLHRDQAESGHAYRGISEAASGWSSEFTRIVRRPEKGSGS